MINCTNCNKEIQDSAKFCPFCGSPVSHTNVNQNQITSNSSVIFKFKKSVMYTMLTEPLKVNLDNQLKFNVPVNRDVCYNIVPGNHTFTAYVPYIGGMEYGSVTKSFYLGINETLEIQYKPPMAILMSGIISIKKM
ncbi:MAG: zinc-ribbon domain-containing protein [Clostridiaceae bacterium]